MGRGINNYKITKEYILSKVSQITIFSVYFDLPVNVIQHCIDTGELIKSPIREDIHPTCGFRYDNKGKLKFKDFAGYFWGDCFDAAALILSSISDKKINISNKNDFMRVLHYIAFTFKDIFYGDEKDENLISNISIAVANIKKQKPNIEIVVRQWNEEDVKYWGQFGIGLQLLNINFVYPVEQYYIDRKVNPEPKYYYRVEDPCYAYYLGKNKDSINHIKLYFPFRNHNQTRFICNSNHLEGIINLARNDYDYIIITKSTKDRLSIINNILNLFSNKDKKLIPNIGVINIPHETYNLRPIEYNWLINKLNENGIILSLMDNDRTGKYEAQKLRKEYYIYPLFIPNKYGAKDFSELVSNTNKQTVKSIIIETIKYIKDYVESSECIIQQKKHNNQPF